MKMTISELAKLAPRDRAGLAAIAMLRLSAEILEDVARPIKNREGEFYDDSGQIALLLLRAAMLGLNLPRMKLKTFFKSPVDVKGKELRFLMRGFQLTYGASGLKYSRQQKKRRHAGTVSSDSMGGVNWDGEIVPQLEDDYATFVDRSRGVWGGPLPVSLAFVEQRPEYWKDTKWSFWLRWLQSLKSGQPIDRKLQVEIINIREDIWDRGVKAVADEIARIEDEYWAEGLPQAEKLIVGNDGKFDVQPDPMPIDDQIDKMFAQVQFALNLSQQSNCGFNTMCVAFKYLEHTLTNCRDDPNAIEQNFRQARDIIRQKILKKEYQEDDALGALVNGLDEYALQLRGSHEGVRKAHEIRVQQKLREVDDATLKFVAGGMRDFQEQRTTGRLYEDTGLDAETVEQDSGVEAQATAIQRTGGRAARANIIDRASKTVQDADASSAYKATRMGATGWTLVDVMKTLFGG